MQGHVNNNLYNNDWYRLQIGASRITQMLWYLVNIIFFINPLNPSSSLKVLLLKCFKARIGKNVLIKPSVNIKYPWKLTVGNNTWIGEHVWIDNLAHVQIGNNVCISQGAMLLTGNHNYTKTSFDLMVKEISLEDGVWIGAKAVVCPGVVCRSHAVLGVLSVANRSLEPFTVYLGNPAVSVRERIID